MLSSLKSAGLIRGKPHCTVGAAAFAVYYGESGKPDALRMPVYRPAWRRRRQRFAVDEPAERPLAADSFERQFLAAPFDQCPVRRIDDLRPTCRCGRPQWDGIEPLQTRWEVIAGGQQRSSRRRRLLPRHRRTEEIGDLEEDRCRGQPAASA